MHFAQANSLDFGSIASRTPDYIKTDEIADIMSLAAGLFGVPAAAVVLHEEPGAIDPDGTGQDSASRMPDGVRASARIMADNGRCIGLLKILGAPGSEPGQEQVEGLERLARIAGRTLQQRAELVRAKSASRDLFRGNPLPMWIYDRHSLSFLDVNDAAVKFYGHSRDAFLRMTVLDIRPPKERERMIASVKNASDLDTAAVWRHCTADGTPIDVITRGRPIIFDGREAVIAVVLDRTDVQALRKDLGDTQLLLDTIITALPIGVFLKDMQDEGRYVIVNPTQGEIVGRPAEAIIGQRDIDVFGGAEGADFVGQDLRVMTSGRQLVIAEEPVTRPSGEARRIRTVKKALPTVDGSAPRYLLGISEDVTERRASEDRMAYMASHDSLTDLPNRLFFERHLTEILGRRNRGGAVTLLCLDLDGFKTINDTYGHHIGDELLKQVAGRLKTGLRRSDVVARLGGDEFAIVTRLPGDPAEAFAIAERVTQCFNQPFDLGECMPHVDVSIGIAMAQARQTAERLMRHADIALYAAKSEGRGIAKLYTESMSTHVEARQLLSEDLRRAVAASQFELDFQPLHDLGSDQIIGFEALVRWRHPVRGLIPPNDFIPLAEQNGLIIQIGDWVLREACRQAATWPEAMKIAVNLSAVQFRKGGLVATVKRILTETGVVPSRLELEITESVLLADSGSNLQILHELRALGVRIAMDDFGTGYSSLSYLRSFPFDKIKMDRSFVTDVCNNPGSVAIVRAVTGLGSSLSITTTAEGIETQEQFNRLKQEGFDELQGYLIGRPMTAERARVLAHAQTSQVEEAAA